MLGMSQERLADQIGVTFQQVQKYEKGTNRIGASRLQAIANVLAVPVAFFFQQDNTQPLTTDGLGAISGLEDLSDFLTSKEGLSLNKAFMKINDPSVRQSVLMLIKSLANTSEPTLVRAPPAAEIPFGLRN